MYCTCAIAIVLGYSPAVHPFVATSMAQLLKTSGSAGWSFFCSIFTSSPIRKGPGLNQNASLKDHPIAPAKQTKKQHYIILNITYLNFWTPFFSFSLCLNTVFPQIIYSIRLEYIALSRFLAKPVLPQADKAAWCPLPEIDCFQPWLSKLNCSSVFNPLPQEITLWLTKPIGQSHFSKESTLFLLVCFVWSFLFVFVSFKVCFGVF